MALLTFGIRYGGTKINTPRRIFHMAVVAVFHKRLGIMWRGGRTSYRRKTTEMGVAIGTTRAVEMTNIVPILIEITWRQWFHTHRLG
jgi:hypothetical protein